MEFRTHKIKKKNKYKYNKNKLKEFEILLSNLVHFTSVIEDHRKRAFVAP